jgi:hypothetical protein
MIWLPLAILLTLAQSAQPPAALASQLPPPNLVENGDARGGEPPWTRSRSHKSLPREDAKDASIEVCDGVPCFVLRNSGGWNQHIRFLEDPTGKHLLIIARGSSERIPENGSITGRPYLWARLIGVEPFQKGVLQGMALQPKAPNAWGTMSGIFRVPPGAVAIHLMLGQAMGAGTPQNGSAARVKDVEVRLFETHEAAVAYLQLYEAQYESRSAQSH